MAKTKDVRAAVEAELKFDPLVDSADIKVMNIGGQVNLTGTVPSYPQYVEAAAAARRIAGVSTVDNNLMVVLPDSDRPCPHLGRTRRGARRCDDGPRGNRRSRRPPGHRLTVASAAPQIRLG
jgi:hypothetical protein